MHKNDGPEKGERIKKKKLIDTYNSMVVTGGKVAGVVVKDKGGRINGGRR